MATTYTTLLKLAKPTQGELDGSWGTVVLSTLGPLIHILSQRRMVLRQSLERQCSVLLTAVIS